MLFALVGGITTAGAVVPALTSTGVIVGLISTASFVALYRLDHIENPALRRVAIIDMILTLALGASLVGLLGGS